MQEIQKTRQEYIQALADVQGKVYQMGLRAEAAVQLALQSLLENDHELADRVMREDDDIDDMIIDIENDCILLIAKQQPMAHDLRVIATGFKISTDIERIGDHAFDIARTAKSDGQLLDREHPRRQRPPRRRSPAYGQAHGRHLPAHVLRALAFRERKRHAPRGSDKASLHRTFPRTHR